MSDELMKYRHALEDVANRLMDLADVLEKKNTYDPVDFLRATEQRCRRLLAGGEYVDSLPEVGRYPENATRLRG